MSQTIHLMKCHLDAPTDCHSALTANWRLVSGESGHDNRRWRVTVVERSHSTTAGGGSQPQHRNSTTAVVAVINKACRHPARDNTSQYVTIRDKWRQQQQRHDHCVRALSTRALKEPSRKNLCPPNCLSVMIFSDKRPNFTSTV